jgi:hypothetical protein
MLKDLLNLFKQQKVTVRSHMKNLIELAAIDGHFDHGEYDLLKSIAKKNGVSASQLKEIQGNSQNVKFEVPLDNSERFQQLYDLVHMMSIDETIQKEELSLCNLFAIKFGYRKEHVDELIHSIHLNIKHGQSAPEAMKRLAILIS